MGKFRSLRGDEKGSVVVLVALAMTALMGFLALVIDVGLLFAERARLMDTADAAALAGAQQLAFSKTDAETVAREFITRNGENVNDFTVEATEEKITVTAKTNVDFYFAPVLGFTDRDVGARAVAAIGPASTGEHVVPIGIPSTLNPDFGTICTLKFNSSSKEEDVLGVGNFGALDLDGQQGGGANDYEKRLLDGYEGVLTVGSSVIIPESGNMKGPTDSAIQERFERCSKECSHLGCTSSACTGKCTPTDYKSGCPRLVIVPVYDIKEMQNNNKVKSLLVVGFAAFFLEHSTEGEIKGCFLNPYTVPGDIDSGAANYGVYSVKLIE